MKRNDAIIIFLFAYLLGGLTMPRGTPDYQTLETQTVRLEQGSINQNVYDVGFSRLDGGGRVVWFDDFRAGIYRYNLTNDAGGSFPAISFEENHLYGFSPSLKFLPVVNGGVSGFDFLASLPISGKCGLEFSVYLSANHARFDVDFGFVYSGSAGTFYNLEIAETTAIISVAKIGGRETIYTPISAGQMRLRHLGLKVVVNPTTGFYDSVFVSGSKIDVSNIQHNGSFNSEPGTVYISFYIEGVSAVLKEPIYLDYLVITADEP